MATYKDPYNLTFNPYVQQRPVEAMMKVGVYKQQRYDEGVQKIQESIDNIAGLDVVRPEDKQYLQSKLNQLGSQLSMVAGGDFSNFQLVNSVNGMTNQIVKDPTIMNAVSNSTKYRKDLETIENHRKEGKWADSNQTAFNKDVNAWFQGGLDASYSANTSPYVNTTKEATDIVKAMAKDYTTEEVVFDYNEAGQIVGVRDALTRKKIEGITPQKIQTALKAGLSPQAWRQLSIDGQYKYSNVSPNAFVNDVNLSYQERFAEITSKREMYENMLPSVTVAEQTRLGNLIKELDVQATDLKSEYNRISSGFASGDLESAKAQFYTMNWLDATSNAMSSKGEELTYHTNPYKEQQNFNRRMEQDAWFAQKSLNVSEARLLFDINKFNAEEARKDKEEQDKKRKQQGQTYLLTDDEFGTSTSKLLNEQKENINLATKNVARQYNTLKNTFGLDDDNIKTALKNPNAIQDNILRNVIINYSKALDEEKKLIERQAALESMATEIANLYDEKYIPQSMIYGTDGAGGTLYHSLGRGDSDLNIANIAARLDMFDKNYKITRSIPAANFNLSLGPAYTTGIPDVYFDNARAEEELPNAKDKNGRRLFSDDDIKLYKVYSGQITPEESGLFSTISMGKLTTNGYNIFMDAVDQYRKNTKGAREKRDEFIAEQLKKEQMLTGATSFSIDKEEFTTLQSDLSDLAIIAQQADGETLDTGVKAETLRDLSQETIKSATYYTNGQGTQGLVVNGKQIPLSEEVYNDLRVASSFEDLVSPSMAFYRNEILPQLVTTLPKLIKDNNGNTVAQNRGYYTTASDSEYNTTPENASYKTYDFPNVKLYKIAANVVTMDEPEKAATVTLQMLVTDPLIGEERRLYIETAIEKIQDAFNMELKQIYSRLYQKEILDGQMPATPSPEYMKALNDAATKVKTD
jgi:hypothetical protein